MEHKVKIPLVHFYHFHKRLFIAGNVGIAVRIFIIMGVLYFFNTFIQSPYLLDCSPIHAEIAILPIRVSIFLFLLIVSRIIRRLSYQLPMIVGLTLIALGTLFILLDTSTLHATYHFFSLSLLLTGLGLSLTFLNNPALGMQALPKEKLGEKSGIIYY